MAFHNVFVIFLLRIRQIRKITAGIDRLPFGFEDISDDSLAASIPRPNLNKFIRMLKNETFPPRRAGRIRDRRWKSCRLLFFYAGIIIIGFFYRDIRFGLGVLPIMYKRKEYDLGFRATTSSRIFPPISSQKPPNFFFLSREKNGLEGSKFDVSNKCPNLGIKSVS
ncbi:Tungstate-binding protein TupA [Frankliniella fusca]|uniref:Tungstate-binding protein TupA n=1 Tax=Frankliniella fusca TaxID=407009 RepID=A0AAE1GY04_9NEOP|nr:Tungstate-binding protein TupA [Frankliniella fusca]KAK3932350.1 Tungstate-binding protein TupA [Frankliniella fusca]